MYHYRESGLDNVYLENGYRNHKTPYGEGVSILDTEGLHKVIGQTLICTQRPLNGAELGSSGSRWRRRRRTSPVCSAHPSKRSGFGRKTAISPSRVLQIASFERCILIMLEEKARYVGCCDGSRI